MAQAPTGVQLKIRPWELGRELAVYLHTLSLGVFVVGASTGNTIFLGRMPDKPEIALAIQMDPAPNAGGLSRPHVTIFQRHTDIVLGATLACRVWEAFDRKAPHLSGHKVFCQCDGEPPASPNSNANNLPVFAIPISISGVPRTA